MPTLGKNIKGHVGLGKQFRKVWVLVLGSFGMLQNLGKLDKFWNLGTILNYRVNRNIDLSYSIGVQSLAQQSRVKLYRKQEQSFITFWRRIQQNNLHHSSAASHAESLHYNTMEFL
jgi:hypothetical protein